MDYVDKLNISILQLCTWESAGLSLLVKRSRQRYLKVIFLGDYKYKGGPQFMVHLLFEFRAEHWMRAIELLPKTQFCRMFCLKHNHSYCTWTLFHIRWCNQQHCRILVAVSHCCSWWMLVSIIIISAVFLSTCHIQTLPVSQHFTSQCIVVWFSTTISGYTLLNVSWTATDCFSMKYYLGMNACSAHEYTIFTPA
jgi:hypothetical protein